MATNDELNIQSAPPGGTAKGVRVRTQADGDVIEVVVPAYGTMGDGSGDEQVVNVTHPLPTMPPRFATEPTHAEIAAAVTKTTILAANANALARSVFNDSATAVMKVHHGDAASATVYTTQVQPGQLYELPHPLYTGKITAVWSAADGSFAHATEGA